MSSLKVEERFVVDAEVLRVWEFLKRPELVAGCLPGAKLEGQEGGDTFVGTMKVKVGPVMQDFRGKATLTEVNDAERKMTISGVGDDKAGGGSARMTMNCQVVPAATGGGSEVSVVADVELAGKLVRFGRGMFEAVAKQLFKQFVERARTGIAAMPMPSVPSAPVPSAKDPATTASTSASEASSATSEASSATSEASSATSEASSATSEASSATSEASSATSEASKPTSEASSATSEASKPTGEASSATSEASKPTSEASKPTSEASKPTSEASKPTSEASPAAREVSPSSPSASGATAPVLAARNVAPIQASKDEALDAGSLIFTVIWEWIKGLFRRLLGRR